MADSPWIDWATGRTVYGVLRNGDQQVWNTSGTPAFQTYAGANWTDYDIAATEQTSGGSSGRYVLTLPTLAAGAYDITFYERVGVSPSLGNDVKLGAVTFEWTGSGFAVSLTAAGTRGAIGLASNNLDAQLATIVADTDAVETRLTSTRAGYLDAAISTRSTLTAANVWDALTSGLATANSIGKLLVDNVNATISSRSTLTAAGVWDAATSGLSTASSIGKLLVDNINATISSRSTLTAAGVWDALVSGISTANSIGKRIVDNLNATVSSRSTFNSATDGVNAEKLANSTAAAERMAQLYGSLRVVAAEAGSTAGAVVVANEDGIFDGLNDYQGLGLECVSGVNAGIIRRVSSYTVVGSLTFNFSGLPGRGDAPFPYAPAEGDEFIIIGRPG